MLLIGIKEKKNSYKINVISVLLIFSMLVPRCHGCFFLTLLLGKSALGIELIPKEVCANKC